MKSLKEIFSEYQVSTDYHDVSDLENVEVIFHWNKKMTELWKQGKFPKLKWVQVISAGVNSVPLSDFREKGVILTNASGIHKYTISEHVIGILLYQMRSLPKVVENQENKDWNQDVSIQQLYGKTMIIVGAGQIGRQLGKLAKVFGMKTIGVNRSGNEIEEMDQTITQERLKEVLGEGDIIVSILPQTPETINYFSKDLFATMKKGVQFVNVGRGTSVVEKDLLEALNNGTVSFAALDVFQTEPLNESSPFWDHENILITPHISGSVEHFRDALFAVMEPNARSYVTEGKVSVNKISYERNY